MKKMLTLLAVAMIPATLSGCAACCPPGLCCNLGSLCPCCPFNRGAPCPPPTYAAPAACPPAAVYPGMAPAYAQQAPLSYMQPAPAYAHAQPQFVPTAPNFYTEPSCGYAAAPTAYTPPACGCPAPMSYAAPSCGCAAPTGYAEAACGEPFMGAVSYAPGMPMDYGCPGGICSGGEFNAPTPQAVTDPTPIAE